MTDAAGSEAAPAALGAPRVRLFRKYAALFAAVVTAALAASGALEIWFVYHEQIASLRRFQDAQASAVADRIGRAVGEIESQIGWTTQIPWSAGLFEQRRFDAQRLLRLVPAITELAQFNADGREQLRVSLLAIDAVRSERDFSADPAFVQASTSRAYYGPIYFRLQSEPFMTLAVAGARRDAGVSVAQVNLKFVWDMISQAQTEGSGGVAYVTDAAGRVIAHPDRRLVLRNTDLSSLPQVRAAIGGGEVAAGADPQGEPVITASARIPALNWFVFVDLPSAEALAPVYASITRTAILLLIGFCVAALAGLALARQMTAPISALRDGAMRLAGGDLSRRISIKTGDEIETLADEFNHMAARLEESYAGLEQKVAQRTAELAHTADELQQKNRELEAFSYSVSHDLRSPLRSIDGFAQALVEDNGAQLDDPGRDRLRRIRNAAQRMGEIIDDLLQLAHVSRAELKRDRVDLADIARSVGDDLQRRDPARQVELIVEPQAVVDADRRLMRVALENLLGNAWKFTSKTAQPKIWFGVQHNRDGDTYFVRDNGAGFEMEYAAKLFRPFQRLHSAADFPGTGIGLATVARVVDRHGGRVWAEGAPDHGATMYFTIGSRPAGI